MEAIFLKILNMSITASWLVLAIVILRLILKKAPKAGMCSEERSMISPDYARNFICDFIIGKEQVGTQLNLF